MSPTGEYNTSHYILYHYMIEYMCESKNIKEAKKKQTKNNIYIFKNENY